MSGFLPHLPGEEERFRQLLNLVDPGLLIGHLVKKHVLSVKNRDMAALASFSASKARLEGEEAPWSEPVLICTIELASLVLMH